MSDELAEVNKYEQLCEDLNQQYLEFKVGGVRNNLFIV